MNDNQFFKRWEAIRQKGRLHYALTQGLRYGVFLTLFINILQVWQTHLTIKEVFLSPTIAYQLVIFTLFGNIVFGTLMWWLYNYLYSKKS